MTFTVTNPDAPASDPVTGPPALAQKSGASPIVIDIEANKIAGAKRLDITGFVCDGAAAGQAWQGAASFFAGPIPASYTALPK